MGAAPGLIYGYGQGGAAGGLIAFLHRGLTGRLLVATILLACSLGRAENVGCMVYNNQLRFSEEELQRLHERRRELVVSDKPGATDEFLRSNLRMRFIQETKKQQEERWQRIMELKKKSSEGFE